MINLTFLETFVWVARLKSFTLAARRLNATQAAVSSRVAALEAELGVKLFVRGARSLSLTPSGVEALARAGPLLENAHVFVDQLTETNQISGSLRIGAINIVSHTWLTDLIRAIKENFPGLTPEVYAETSLKLLDLLRVGEIDLALIIGPVFEPSYVSIELCRYSCHWMASPGLHFDPRPVNLEDLVRHTVISPPKESKFHGHITRFFCQHRHHNIRFFTANSLEAIIRMTIAGVGIATIPPVVVLKELARGELALLETEKSIPPMDIHAVWFEGPTQCAPAAIAELARQVAYDFSSRSNPAWVCDSTAMIKSACPKNSAYKPE